MSEKSKITVDPLTYQDLLRKHVASLIEQGYSVAGAYVIAREEIADAFLCDPFQQIIEDEKDAADERTDLTR